MYLFENIGPSKFKINFESEILSKYYTNEMYNSLNNNIDQLIEHDFDLIQFIEASISYFGPQLRGVSKTELDANDDNCDIHRVLSKGMCFYSIFKLICKLILIVFDKI